MLLLLKVQIKSHSSSQSRCFCLKNFNYQSEMLFHELLTQIENAWV